jgi:hypothetical protein
MRLVMASVMAGMAIGATIELAVAHWRDSDVAPPPMAGSINEGSLVGGAAAVLDIPVISARPSASAADTDGLTLTRPKGLCKETGPKDLAADFLNPTCGSDKPHARHAARTTYRVATVIVGRTNPPPASAAKPTPVAVTAIEPSHAALGATAKAAASTTQSVVRPAAAPKKLKVAASAPIVLIPPTREPTQ